MDDMDISPKGIVRAFFVTTCYDLTGETHQKLVLRTIYEVPTSPYHADGAHERPTSCRCAPVTPSQVAER